ncbi:MAG: SDR family NAD(P)-dependent oxidoreductase [Candidatus Puniceispirillaceae bacterium]|jgi:NAD(P)-dependent dehydrogenase (short-subunit alcohol dehydrogenase family)|tara:strand:+ start:974 stop:1732 length:759 start_codon:yes stop_codon:yes gene_type:complete
MAIDAIYPSLKDKTVLITGGGSGIGEALTRAFIAQSAKVGFLDYDKAASETLAAELDSPDLHFEYCDLRDIDALQVAVKAVSAKLGPIRILVNNAARDDRHSLESVTSDYFDERIATNLKHQLFAAQAVAGPMAAAGGGSIINMGSTSWMIGQGGMPCYTTAKSAVQGLTRGLARDLGPDNIRVNAVIPGWIMTQRQIDMWLTEESEKELMQRQCVKRKLIPEDIARFVLFMASDEAGACSNQSYIVDGGWV